MFILFFVFSTINFNTIDLKLIDKSLETRHTIFSYHSWYVYGQSQTDRTSATDDLENDTEQVPISKGCVECMWIEWVWLFFVSLNTFNLTQSPSVTLIVGPGIVSLNVQACGNTKPLLAIGIELFSFMNNVNSLIVWFPFWFESMLPQLK